MITGQTTSLGLVHAWGLTSGYKGGDRKKRSGANVRFLDVFAGNMPLFGKEHTRTYSEKKRCKTFMMEPHAAAAPLCSTMPSLMNSTWD